MKCYKLTDKHGETRGNTKWGPGISHETDGTGRLCSSGWLHFYRDPLLAVLLNPIHANFPGSMRLWEAKAGGRVKNNAGLKSGCTKLTTTREIPVPKVTTEQRVRFAILCVKQVCIEPEWNRWADAWLSNEDRSALAAEAAWAAKKATNTAWASAGSVRAAEWAAAEAAWASVRAAARAAAEAAAWASERSAAKRVAWASVRAAECAAESASEATMVAKAARKPIDLSSIARKSVDTAEC